VDCAWCDNTGWVCEDHPNRPWLGISSRADACHCGGAGVPCERWNADGQKNGIVQIVAGQTDSSNWRQILCRRSLGGPVRGAV